MPLLIIKKANLRRSSDAADPKPPKRSKICCNRDGRYADRLRPTASDSRPGSGHSANRAPRQLTSSKWLVPQPQGFCLTLCSRNRLTTPGSMPTTEWRRERPIVFPMMPRTATRSVTLRAWRDGSISGDTSGAVTARRNAKCERRAEVNLWVALASRSGRGRASHVRRA
jgi:hypothetical protein